MNNVILNNLQNNLTKENYIFDLYETKINEKTLLPEEIKIKENIKYNKKQLINNFLKIYNKIKHISCLSDDRVDFKLHIMYNIKSNNKALMLKEI